MNPVENQDAGRNNGIGGMQSVTVGTIDKALLDITKFDGWDHDIITTDQQQELASNRLGLIATHTKELKKRRDFLLAPIKEAQKRITDAANTVLVPLERIDRQIRAALGQYLNDKRLKQEAEERRRRDETAAQMRREAEAKLNEAAKANSNIQLEAAVETEQLANRIAAKEVVVRPSVRTETGSQVTSMVSVKWEVTDLDALPKGFMVVDEKKINAIARAYKANPMTVPGVRFFEVTTPVVRGA